jgi:hypothetical protein
MNPLSGAYRVCLNQLADNHGVFVKTHMRSVFAANVLRFLRGISLGFQKGLHPRHALPISAIRPRQDRVLPGWRGGGRVVGFAQRAPPREFCSILLSEDQPELIVVPKGVAHGFRSLKDRSFMVSKASTGYAPLRWDSFGFDWRCESPILSDRDQLNQIFADFKSPLQKIFPTFGTGGIAKPSRRATIRQVTSLGHDHPCCPHLPRIC